MHQVSRQIVGQTAWYVDSWVDGMAPKSKAVPFADAAYIVTYKQLKEMFTR